jgi:hypothetical protein
MGAGIIGGRGAESSAAPRWGEKITNRRGATPPGRDREDRLRSFGSFHRATDARAASPVSMQGAGLIERWFVPMAADSR